MDFFSGIVSGFQLTSQAGGTAGLLVAHPEDSSQDYIREANLKLFGLLRDNLSFWLRTAFRITITARASRPAGWPSAPVCFVTRFRSGAVVRTFCLDGYFDCLLRKESRGQTEGAWGKGNELGGWERLFRRLSLRRAGTLDLDMDLLLQRLSNRDVQLLLNVLLREKKMEETMLAGFIQAHPESSNILATNLSRNVREEVERLGKFPSLWARQSTWLIRHAMTEVWRQGALEIGLFNELAAFLDRESLALYKERFSGRALEELSSADSDGSWYAEMCRSLPSVLLARAFRSASRDLVERLRSAMVSDNQRQTFDEDLVFSRTREGEDDHSRRKVIEFLVDRLSRREAADKDRPLGALLLGLSGPDLNYTVSETGPVRFAKAVRDLAKSEREKILNRIDFLPRSIMRDLFSGRTRFKEALTPAEIEECRTGLVRFVISCRKLGLIAG